MKFTATLAASAYAAATAVTGVTAPTAITSGETANTATFPGTTGVWTWLLYGATASDEDGYYLRIVTSAATKFGDVGNTSYTALAMANATSQFGAETGLIKYLVVADDDNSGQEISWNVAYSGDANATTSWDSIAITQTFGASGSVSATGTDGTRSTEGLGNSNRVPGGSSICITRVCNIPGDLLTGVVIIGNNQVLDQTSFGTKLTGSVGHSKGGVR